MKRLTERLGDYNNPKGICAVWVKNHDYVSAAHRLADYEDIADTVGGFDRLRELAEADKGGRLLVLPCQSGERVFALFDGQKHVRECEVKHAVLDDRRKVFYIVPIGDPGNSYGASFGAFGQTVFLTREEAEAALEKDFYGRADNG